jgi:hypothetical protein
VLRVVRRERRVAAHCRRACSAQLCRRSCSTAKPFFSSRQAAIGLSQQPVEPHTWPHISPQQAACRGHRALNTGLVAAGAHELARGRACPQCAGRGAGELAVRARRRAGSPHAAEGPAAESRRAPPQAHILCHPRCPRYSRAASRHARTGEANRWMVGGTAAMVRVP